MTQAFGSRLGDTLITEIENEDVGPRPALENEVVGGEGVCGEAVQK